MTGNWQEGDTGDLATQFLWCGGGGGKSGERMDGQTWKQKIKTSL